MCYHVSSRNEHCRNCHVLYDSNFSWTAATPPTRSAKSLVNGPEEPINRSEQPSGSAQKKKVGTRQNVVKACERCKDGHRYDLEILPQWSSRRLFFFGGASFMALFVGQSYLHRFSWLVNLHPHNLPRPGRRV